MKKVNKAKKTKNITDKNIIKQVLKSGHTVYINKQTEVVYDVTSKDKLIRADKNSGLKTLKFESNMQNIENTLLKSRIVGYKIYESIDFLTENKLYSIYTDKEIRIISDKQIILTVATEAFSNIQLKAIEFNNVDTSNLLTTVKMFSESKIGNIDLSNVSFSKIINAGQMFKRATIEKLNLGANQFKRTSETFAMFDTASIKELSIDKDMFSKVEKLENTFFQTKTDSNIELNIDNAKRIDAMFMGGAFKTVRLNHLYKVESYACLFINSELEKIEFNDMNTSIVKSFEEAFNNCMIPELTLKNLDFKNINTMNMFETPRFFKLSIENCTGLDLEILKLEALGIKVEET